MQNGPQRIVANSSTDRLERIGVAQKRMLSLLLSMAPPFILHVNSTHFGQTVILAD
jgi:hypothetical protein